MSKIGDETDIICDTGLASKYLEALASHVLELRTILVNNPSDDVTFKCPLTEHEKGEPPDDKGTDPGKEVLRILWRESSGLRSPPCL
jgi:hypothetical protein